MLLVYRIPREPSRHRVAVWRKLRDLGALYLQDGVAALPEDAVTREQMEWLQLRVREAGGEQMEWLQLRVREAGGEATLWEARPGTAAEEGELVATFRAAREEAFRGLIAGAECVRRKAEMGGGAALSEPLGKLERAFRAERRRDYFRSPLRAEARDALRAARRAVREAREGAGPSARGEAG